MSTWKPLYNDEYEGELPEAKQFEETFARTCRQVVKDASDQGYSIRHLLAIMIMVVTNCCAEASIIRASKQRQKNKLTLFID